ncbi:MAG: type II secretion system F family protein [Pirellulales bacterium]|nr:type II secretion system F family protein [Pirellulales bacterium]
MTGSGKSSHVSLDQLIALNEEIAALAVAGVPLERNLAGLARDLPGTSRSLANRIAVRLERGDSLYQAIEAEGDSLPRIYRAMVLAGLRSGHLPSALHALTETARRVAETRRIVGMAMFYPLIVIVIAWFLFGLTVGFIMPSFQWLDVAELTLVKVLSAIKTSVWWWMPIVPGILIILAVAGWFVSGRAKAIDVSGGSARRFGARGTILRLGHAATFADMLALLLEQATPLDEALLLAADTTMVPEWCEASGLLAEAIHQGQSITANQEPLHRLPPLVRLALLRTGRPEQIISELHAAAETYRNRARRRARWLALMLPTFLIVVLGGGVVLAYTLIVFWPYVTALREMSGCQWK